MAVAALEESVRRIASIALVHETLTEELEGAVDMAEVARRVVRMLESSLGREDVRIALSAGSVRVDAAVATPFAVVLTELVQNAIEHGLCEGPGLVTVTLRGGDGKPIELEVADDGSGLAPPASGETAPPTSGETAPPTSGVRGSRPPGVHASPASGEAAAGSDRRPGGGLGLRLVRALVEEELGGQFTLILRPGQGSLAVAAVPPGEGPG
jgi:hypothetical protein